MWDSAVDTSGDGGCGDGRVGAGGLRPEGSQYQCECILSLLGIASFPGLPRGEGRPGTHCSRMRQISRHSGNSVALAYTFRV